MRSFSFKKNFKQLGFQSPDWQKAKLLFKSPIHHISRVKDKILQHWRRINPNQTSTTSKEVKQMDVLIGKVTHFYDKIGVAIVGIEKQQLKAGDTIKISGHDQEFTQKVDSMQSEHQQILEASPGMTVGIKTDRPVKENDQVYLTS